MNKPYLNTDGESLFRSEAVEFSRSRLGSPTQNFGLKSWVLVVFLTVVFAVVVIFISTAKYARTETVLGVVTPSQGVERVAPLRAGIIKQVLVRNGDRVVAGQPLYVLSYDAVLEGGSPLSDRVNQTSQEQLASVELQTRVKKQQIAQTRVETSYKISGLQDDIAHLSTQKILQQQRVALLQKDFDAASILAEKQFISEVQLRQKQDALLQSRQNLTQLEENISQAQSQIAQLKSQVKSSALAVQQADADMGLSRAQFEEKQTSNLSAQGAQIVALTQGRASNIEAHMGDLVTANQVLNFVVPQGARMTQVVLWVPSRAIGFVAVGTKVRLMFDAFPYQTFGVGKGYVSEISTVPLMPSELPVPIETREQMYKLVVALDSDELTAYGRKWALMPGMRLTADLVLEERSFLDWLLDPLLASRKRTG